MVMGQPTNSVKPFDANKEYTGGQYKASQRFTMRQGDPRVHDLFVEYTNFPQRTVYWEFRKQVIDLALVLFGGNYNWFLRQDHNATLTGVNYDFLLDTVRFIATGKRRVNLHTWPALLTYEPTQPINVEERRNIAGLFHELNLSLDTKAIIQKWCTHKGGFDDLMYTMNMLFGTVPEKVNK
ncbi:virion structural protein [Pseudomonas phage PhiPA3]|uniref:Virion structural protein n=1 Tax=Pseudomonas phage PhiPA3 TaxID=998086 RepID=F8SJL1_BPPA3|nr:virion structural protein [Pseudomonas phage PhiPA3]AEH03518.1 virion structural protein [Pseudomonas phage PhiPA3]